MPIPTTNLVCDLKAGVGITTDGSNNVQAWTPQAGSLSDNWTMIDGYRPRNSVDDLGNPCVQMDWGSPMSLHQLFAPSGLLLDVRNFSIWIVASHHGAGIAPMMSLAGYTPDVLGATNAGGTYPKLTACGRASTLPVPINKGLYGVVSGASSLKVHNAATSEVLAAADAGTPSGGGRLGCDTAFVEGFSGRMYRVVIYSGAQSDADAAATKAALIAEHGLVVSYKRRLVCEGDSRTQGFRTTLARNFTYRLGQRFLRSWEVYNIALLGAKTPTIITQRAGQIDPLWISGARTEFTNLSGTNDDENTTGILASLKTLCAGVKAAKPWTGVRVTTELPRSAPSGSGSYAAFGAMNAMIRSDASGSWDAVNDLGIGSTVETRLQDASNTAYWHGDELHPNDGGAEVMAEFFRAAYSVGYAITGGGTSAAGVPSGVFTVTPSDGFPFSGFESITLTSNEASDTITPSVGSPGTGAVTVTPASGATSFTFTITRAAAGTSTITPTNAQAWNDPATVEYEAVTADTPPTITSASTKAGQVGAALSYTITATGTAPITFGVSGALPDGVTFDGVNTGVNTISGTPTTAGESVVSITAENAFGSAESPLTFTISPPTLTGYTLAGPATGQIGKTRTFTIAAEPSGALFTGTEVFTPVNTGLTGSFSAATVTPAAGASSVTFNFTGTALGSGTIGVTDNQGWADPAAIAFEVLEAVEDGGRKRGLSGIAGIGRRIGGIR